MCLYDQLFCAFFIGDSWCSEVFLFWVRIFDVDGRVGRLRVFFTRLLDFMVFFLEDFGQNLNILILFRIFIIDLDLRLPL